MISEKSGFLSADIKVVPGSSINKLDLKDGMVYLKIKAPPVEGRANKAAVDFLSKLLSIPKKNISIIKGENSRNKIFRLEGITMDGFMSVLKG